MAENLGKPVIRKKKENITVTVSPYLKKQLDEMVESGDFSSMSDLAMMAFSEFVTKYNIEKEKQSTTESNNKNPTEDIVLRRKVVFD
jgi:Arc/MetJ-type ribon-helix-helix transcriptional regulator